MNEKLDLFLLFSFFIFYHFRSWVSRLHSDGHLHLRHLKLQNHVWLFDSGYLHSMNASYLHSMNMITKMFTKSGFFKSIFIQNIGCYSANR